MLLAYDTSAHHSVAGACIASGAQDKTLPVPTFRLPRSKHLPCLALRQHEECDMFFSPQDQEYSMYLEMASKLFRTTLTFRMAYGDAKEVPVPHDLNSKSTRLSFRNLNQITSLIMKNLSSYKELA